MEIVNKINEKIEQFERFRESGYEITSFVDEGRKFYEAKKYGFIIPICTALKDSMRVIDLVDTAIKDGIINKAGAWFTFVDPDTGEIVTDDEGKEIKIQGQAGVIQFVRDNEEMRIELAEQVRKF